MSGAAKFCLLLGGFIALATLAWMVFLPAIAERELRSVTGFDVRVTVLAANPLTGRVVVRGLTVKNPPRYPASDFLELRELRAEVGVFSWLFTDRVVIDDLDLRLDKVELVLQHNGKSNAGEFIGAFSRGATAVPAPAPRKGARYLVRRLHVRLDRLVIADYSGPKLDEKSYDLHIDSTYRDVTSPRQLLVPDVVKSLHSFGLNRDVGRLLPGDFGRALADAVGEAAQAGSKLKYAGKKTGEYLKGLIDKLDQSAKP